MVKVKVRRTESEELAFEAREEAVDPAHRADLPLHGIHLLVESAADLGLAIHRWDTAGGALW